MVVVIYNIILKLFDFSANSTSNVANLGSSDSGRVQKAEAEKWHGEAVHKMPPVRPPDVAAGGRQKWPKEGRIAIVPRS